jgi:sensor histidine kinase YesM
MNSWLETANIAIASAGLTISFLGLFLAIIMRRTEEWESRFFAVFFFLLTIYTASNLIEQLAYMVPGPEAAAVSRVSLFIESLFSSMLTPSLTVLILHFAGEDIRRSRMMRTVTGLWIIYFILLVITQFTEFIYYYTDDNVYYRGKYYPLLLIPPALTMLTNLVGLIRRRNRMSRRKFIALFFLITVPLVSIMIQMTSYGLLVIVLGSSVSAFAVFVLLMKESTDEQLRQREVNVQQQASIAVLQMRPHFISNALMSIYYLCGQDPARAQKVILDFSSYLRKNFTAIAGGSIIPFTEELEHTSAYLAVETVRFEDMLSVEYDTSYTNFRIPPLTLQPIVENAVKHGLDPDGDPLHIIIRSFDTDSESVIIVEDNGTGFDPDNDDKPHTALDNIRNRLEMMCGGSMKIESSEKSGTIVTISIPHSNQ